MPPRPCAFGQSAVMPPRPGCVGQSVALLLRPARRVRLAKAWPCRRAQGALDKAWPCCCAPHAGCVWLKRGHVTAPVCVWSKRVHAAAPSAFGQSVTMSPRLACVWSKRDHTAAPRAPRAFVKSCPYRRSRAPSAFGQSVTMPPRPARRVRPIEPKQRRRTVTAPQVSPAPRGRWAWRRCRPARSRAAAWAACGPRCTSPRPPRPAVSATPCRPAPGRR